MDQLLVVTLLHEGDVVLLALVKGLLKLRVRPVGPVAVDEPLAGVCVGLDREAALCLGLIPLLCFELQGILNGRVHLHFEFLGPPRLDRPGKFLEEQLVHDLPFIRMPLSCVGIDLHVDEGVMTADPHGDVLRQIAPG